MTHEVVAGWLQGARRCVSPHCDDRPAGVTVELVVIHGLSLPAGEFGGPWIEHLFRGDMPRGVYPGLDEVAELRVSAHLLVRRDGSVTQFVPFERRAWHAGQSSWQSRADCNDFSIGIELEGRDDTPYADSQYIALAQLVPALRRGYPGISADAIVGHEHIAPGRKTDPGPAFDWARLRGDLQVA
jgi:AmpD protein